MGHDHFFHLVAGPHQHRRWLAQQAEWERQRREEEERERIRRKEEAERRERERRAAIEKPKLDALLIDSRRGALPIISVIILKRCAKLQVS